MRDLIRFRPATDDDIPFLSALYATTREDEMKLVPWTDEEKAAFLKMQFDAQKYHYDRNYPDCEFLVIEKSGESIGRLYIERFPDEICIVDIALMPEHRGSGLGTMLLKEILEEAEQTNRVVSIYVESFNPALRLYQRLGFEHIDTNGVYNKMRWSAPATK